MMRLFDEDYIWEVFIEEKEKEQESYKKGYEEGYAKGYAEGIRKGRILQTIEIYREEKNLPNSVIRQELCERFHLTPEKAADWMKHSSETIGRYS